MKETVIAIDAKEDCVRTVALTLNGKGSGIDGLTSIRRTLKVYRNHKPVPMMFYLDMEDESFGDLRPVVFIDDNCMREDIKKHTSWGTRIPLSNLAYICSALVESDIHVYGNAVICFMDTRNHTLVGMNDKQVSVIQNYLNDIDGWKRNHVKARR